MLDFEYVFVLRGELAEEFCSQTEELSELILELGARKQLPKTWKLVDWLRTRPKAAPEVLEKRKKHQTVLGLLVLLLALFALGPTMIAPKELLTVLLAGEVCLGAGIVSLWKRHRIMLAIPLILAGLFYGIAGLGGGEEFWPLLTLGVVLIAVAVLSLIPRRKKQNRAAMQDVSALFERRSAIPEGKPIYIRFAQQGVQAFTQQEQGEILPYDTVSGILETADLLVIVMEKQGFLLAKSELSNGVFSDFKAELSTRVLWLTKKGMNGYGKARTNSDRRF